MSRLLVIVPDRMSEIIAKGEYQPCYYNPGEVFDEVCLLSTTDDAPSPELMQRTVGRARLGVYTFPDDLDLVQRRPGWLRGWRLRRWARRGVALARTIAPDLIRCHGADWNTYLASRIKAATGTPYVVSLHINPDVNPVRRLMKPDPTPAERRHDAFYHYLEHEGLRHADLVMPVYSPILPYLDRLGITRREVCYNVLNGAHLRVKQSYALHAPARLLYVGRLLPGEKDPGLIVEALAGIDGAELTIVGDGPLRPALTARVAALGIGQRVRFEPAVANDVLCARLADHDLFVVHSEYFEISKSVLEALLTGLPVVINRRRGDPVPELEGDFVRRVAHTVEDWREAIVSLLRDDAGREALGRRAAAHAGRHWAPAVSEARVAGIYRRLLAERARVG